MSLEDDIRVWLEKKSNIKFEDQKNFHKSLKNGVILCT
jgi:hypothetical protein